jgi:hypothetical protein
MEELVKVRVELGRAGRQLQGRGAAAAWGAREREIEREGGSRESGVGRGRERKWLVGEGAWGT